MFFGQELEGEASDFTNLRDLVKAQAQETKLEGSCAAVRTFAANSKRVVGATPVAVASKAS